MSKKTSIGILFFILLLGAFFRFYLLTETPPGLYPDEAMNGNNALEALETRDFKTFYPENNGREGLYINLQALSLWFFGNEPWTLRIVSAVFGTLTIWGLYLLTKETLLKSDFNNYRGSTSIALLASFFLATSFWHINFSRIGFRAILVPFFATFGIYFLLKGLREGKIFPLVWAGIFIGLGFHAYIAFRFMPLVIMVPILWYLWQWWRGRDTSASPTSRGKSDLPTSASCLPCAILLFIFITFVVALPIGLYFLQNPGDLVGRAGDVSIFSAESPVLEFAKSNIATLGMFFASGDCNWRHNYNCSPFVLTGVLGLAGAVYLWRAGFKKEFAFVLIWLIFLSLPATLTREGLPHALRSIGMIPPLMILEGLGAWSVIQLLSEWLERQKTKWPRYTGQLIRIRKETTLLFLLLLLMVPLMAYRQYFVKWSNSPNTYFAFTTDVYHLGQFLNALPDDVDKYVVVNLPGVDIRGIPAPAQTVMFATNTFREERRKKRNIRYLLPYEANKLRIMDGQKTVIALLGGDDRELISAFQKENPGFRVKVPGDFVILEN